MCGQEKQCKAPTACLDQITQQSLYNGWQEIIGLTTLTANKLKQIKVANRVGPNMGLKFSFKLGKLKD